MIVISTQYLENYGDAENPYWKYKGGSDYKILNFIGREQDAAALVNKIRSRIEYANDFSQEYILGWNIMPDDSLTVSERDQLEYEGKITYPAEIVETN